MKTRYQAIVMGVSAGGSKALSAVLPRFDPAMPVPIFIVQHLSPSADCYLVEHLRSICRVEVKVAEDKEQPCPGVVYLAPPDYHLLIEDHYSLALSLDYRVNYSRPAIDVLFVSGAEAYQRGLIGVVMTGANGDGACGLRRIKECGGLTVVQDPETAAVDIMPLAALAAVEVDHVVALDELGNFLNTLVMGQ